jgi:hypothetical protein
MKILFTDQDMGDVSLERGNFRDAGIELIEARCKTESAVVTRPAGYSAVGPR